MSVVLEGSLKSEMREERALTNPVFVVGVLRSGTSLLYSLLNQHPQMAFMYECDAWNFPEVLSSARLKGNWLERQEFFNQALSRHRLVYGKSLRGLENVRTPDDLYEVFGQGKGAALWGEKSPFYCCRLLRLAERNPQSPFILIWRDPVEIYRSVVHAGRTTRFFRRPGMLSRLIRYHEKMIEQATALEKTGARVYHVTYADLVDNTAEVCEGICKFLGVPFDPRMLDSSSADFSAVYQAAQHDYLRRGVIRRQKLTNELLNTRSIQKLERFRNRWNRLSPGKFIPAKSAVGMREPSFFERVRHGISGKLLCTWDDTKRVLFEFMPLDWLHTYRGAAQWFFSHGKNGREPNRSLSEQLAAHWITVAVSYFLIAGLGFIDAVDPHFSLLPFYLIPCAILALTINWRWGTVAAVIASCISPALISRLDESFAQVEVFLWNSSMRFLLFEFVVLVLDRVRREFNSRKTENS
jgi:hypothetical protein